MQGPLTLTTDNGMKTAEIVWPLFNGNGPSCDWCIPRPRSYMEAPHPHPPPLSDRAAQYLDAALHKTQEGRGGQVKQTTHGLQEPVGLYRLRLRKGYIETNSNQYNNNNNLIISTRYTFLNHCWH